MNAPRVVVALVMLATSVLVGLPTAAQAAPTLYTSSDGQYEFYCTLGGHSAILETYLGSSTDITVPATVSSTESGSCQVDTLGVSVYRGKGLASVTFQHKPDVPAGAFANNSIATVQLASGAGTTSIEAGAFASQTVGGATVIGWLGERDMIVADIAGSYSSGRFEAVTRDRFTVSFDPKNGSEPVFEQQVFDGDLATAPPAPAEPPLGDADSVTFEGWFTPGGERFNFGGPITSDAQAEAHWNFVFTDSWTVTLEPENGAAASTLSVRDGNTFGAPAAPVPAPPLGEGADRVVFIGWIPSLSGDASLFDFDTPITDDITLYAVWDQVTLDRHTVTFVPNDDGSDDPSFTVEVLDGEAVTEPAEPTPFAETRETSWEFRAWGDTAGDPYDFDTPVTGDLTLTAGWRENSKIIYSTFTARKLTFTPPTDDIPTFGAGETLDLTLDQLGELADLTLPGRSQNTGSLLFVNRQRNLSVTGCVSPSSTLDLEALPPSGITLIISVKDPACFSGTSAETVIPGPPEGGPVPQGTLVKLCQIFCYRDATATVESTPRFLGTTTSDEVGRMSLTTTIPADLEPGRHTLVFTVEGGEELRYPINVTAPALLPDTGAPGSPSLLGWSVLMLVGGASMVVASRRQDSSERR